MNIEELIKLTEKTIGKESATDAFYRNISTLEEKEQLSLFNFHLNDYFKIIKDSKLDINLEEKVDFGISILLLLAIQEKESMEDEIEFLINILMEGKYISNVNRCIELLSENINSNFSNSLSVLETNKNLTSILSKRLYKLVYCIGSINQTYIDNKMKLLDKFK